MARAGCGMLWAWLWLGRGLEGMLDVVPVRCDFTMCHNLWDSLPRGSSPPTFRKARDFRRNSNSLTHQFAHGTYSYVAMPLILDCQAMDQSSVHST